MLWYTKSRRAQSVDDYETWLEGGVMPTLNSFDNGDVRTTILITTASVIGSLQARDYKGVGNQYVAENKLIVSFDTQFGSNATTFEDMSPTLKASQQPPSVTGTSVRRLTPLECERLQGFPDGWTEGQSDTQRYKQMGNAVAVPVVEWIIQGICDTV
jgi:site-specific DNA-cytosine methylase